MKKTIALALTLVIAVGLFAGCGGSSKADDTLYLFTWAEMFPQDVLNDFSDDTGIEIIYSNFDTDENMFEKLKAADGGDYDVVIADDYIIRAVIEEGLAQKLDQSKLDNFDNVNPVYQGTFYDPTNEYTVPYGSGVQTIVYNPEKVTIDITGYKDLWDESLKDSIGIIGNPRVINGMALKVAGESYNTEDLEVIRNAGDALIELAPNIHLIKDDNLDDDLISGEIDAAIMYTSQVTGALMANPDLEFVFPEEGIGFGIMANFIPVNAPNPEAAHKFIDFILRPDISARCFEFMGYYSTNKEADLLLDPAIKDLITFPEDLNLDGMELIDLVSPEAEAVHMEVWTAFKNATGK